jgi:hypothetical protein
MTELQQVQTVCMAFVAVVGAIRCAWWCACQAWPFVTYQRVRLAAAFLLGINATVIYQQHFPGSFWYQQDDKAHNSHDPRPVVAVERDAAEQVE